MCLGEVGEVAVVGDGAAEVRIAGRVVTVSLLTLDQAVLPGDWLLVHSGFALTRLTPADADQALRLRGAR